MQNIGKAHTSLLHISECKKISQRLLYSLPMEKKLHREGKIPTSGGKNFYVPR